MRKKLIQCTRPFIPSFILDELVRRFVQLPSTIPENLVFKIAETKEELEATFRLVYESYLELGYCTQNEFKMRATVYHALPSTTTLIALDQGQVVGTLTIVRDNRLGLPLEKAFNVKFLRKNSNRLAEITSLVIDKNHRRENGGLILFPLLRLMYEYSTSCFGVNRLLVTIHPKNIDFYKSLLLFNVVPNTETLDYLGAPAICLELNLNKALLEFKNTYSKRNDLTNLYHFFVEKKIPNICLPLRKYHKINDPLVDLSYYYNFFVEQLKVSPQSTERRRVESCLRDSKSQRSDPRIEVEAHAHFRGLKLTVKDVSRHGLRISFANDFDIEESIELQIEVAPNTISYLTTSVVWLSSDNCAGLEIESSDENWKNYIHFLYSDQFGKTG